MSVLFCSIGPLSSIGLLHICLLEHRNEVDRVLLIPIFVTKTFYHQGKIYVPVLVCPDSVGNFCWYIAVGFRCYLSASCAMISDCTIP